MAIEDALAGIKDCMDTEFPRNFPPDLSIPKMRFSFDIDFELPNPNVNWPGIGDIGTFGLFAGFLNSIPLMFEDILAKLPIDMEDPEFPSIPSLQMLMDFTLPNLILPSMPEFSFSIPGIGSVSLPEVNAPSIPKFPGFDAEAMMKMITGFVAMIFKAIKDFLEKLFSLEVVLPTLDGLKAALRAALAGLLPDLSIDKLDSIVLKLNCVASAAFDMVSEILSGDILV